MKISATYICPVRGFGGLEPPEMGMLGKAAGIAKDLGLERLLLPVLDECLLQTARAKIKFLDGLIQALDRVSEKGHMVWIMAPASRILGLNLAPPYLVSAARAPKASPVFVDGHIRHLGPFKWWADPSLISKRIENFREVVSAVQGHPAITGWLILDRFLEWSRPDIQSAELVLRSFIAEIRQRDETKQVCLGIGWFELLDPDKLQVLGGYVDGFRLAGLEDTPPGLRRSSDLAEELYMAAYLGSLVQWLFKRPTEIEIGWGLLQQKTHPEDYIEAGRTLAKQALAGAVWSSFVDPGFALIKNLPWNLRPGLEHIGLLDRGLLPKGWVETWVEEICATPQKESPNSFIDLDREEYMADPHTHLTRLWDHFQDSL